MSKKEFAFPDFHDYPPYFTLQPVDVTKDEQCRSWGNLILSYCKHNKIFSLHVNDSEDTELFSNHKIDRKLSLEAKRYFFNWLIEQGNGTWRDPARNHLLVLWKTIPQWANTILGWAEQYGREESVVTVDEISHGDETSGTELERLDREIIIRAVAILESKGRAKLFRGTSQDDEGVKFFKQQSQSA